MNKPGQIMLSAMTSAACVFAALLPTALKAAEEPHATAAQIERWVTALGDDAFWTREHAERELTEIGRPAIAAIGKAARQDDAEIRFRARRILFRFARRPDDPATRTQAERVLEEIAPGVLARMRRERARNWLESVKANVEVDERDNVIALSLDDVDGVTDAILVS